MSHTPLWGTYIPKFSNIFAKFTVFGVLCPYRCTNGVKFCMEEWTLGSLLSARFHPHWCNMSPLLGEKPPNCTLSNLNTGSPGARGSYPAPRVKVFFFADSGSPEARLQFPGG